MDGEQWIARVAGVSTAGSGVYGLGRMEAIHFARAEAPDQSVREVLLQCGRFPYLYDAELSELCARAPAIAQRPPLERKSLEESH
jgi:hypothetical protein